VGGKGLNGNRKAAEALDASHIRHCLKKISCISHVNQEEEIHLGMAER